MNQLLAMRTFVRLVETGAFARAADQMSTPRSTVSKLVADLERHLGAKLVQRTTRQVTITPEGMAYYERIVGVLADLEEADDAVRGSGLSPRGRLRIDVPAILARHLLIPALPDFALRYPEIDVAVGVGDRQIDIVGEGVDCVIRGGELGDPAFIARKLTELEYGTFATPAYVERHGRPAAPVDLRTGHSLVGYFSPTTERPQPMIFERGGERIEIAAASFAANDGLAQMEMIRSGLGVGQHFVRFARPLVEAGELVPLLPDWRRPAFPVHAVYLRDRHRSARLTVFLDWLVKTLRGDPA